MRCIAAALALACLGVACTSESSPLVDVQVAVDVSDGDTDGSGDSDVGDATDLGPDVFEAPWTAWPATEVTFAPLEAALTDFYGGPPPSLSIIAVRGTGEVIHRKGYGNLGADAIFLTASAAKPIAAGIVRRLHDLGHLGVDDFIADVVPWGDVLPGATVEHLVTHRSGIPGLYPQNELPNAGVLPGGWAECYGGFEDLWTLQTCRDELVAALRDDPEVQAYLVPPNTVYRYGGSQWGLAGALAEEVSGISWAQLFDDTYGTPCGLKASGWVSGAEVVPQLAGITQQYASLGEIPSTANPNIEGGMHTTLDDYAAILLMHLHGGACVHSRAFPAEAIADMHRAVSPGVGIEPDAYGLGDAAGYGYGWYSEKGDEGSWVGTAGSGGVWAVIDKANDLVLMVVSDDTDNLSVAPDKAVMPLVWDVVAGP